MKYGLAKAWLGIVVATLGSAIISKIFVAQELAAAIGGAVLARIIADRSGALAADDARPPRDQLRSAAIAIGIVVVAIAVAAALALATGQARLFPGEFSLFGAGLALLRSVALGSRDEVAFRLLPIELFGRLGARRGGVAVAILLGFASADPLGAPAAAILALALGVLTSALYVRDGDAIGAIAANTAARFVTGTVLVSMAELRLKSGTFVPFEHAKGPVTLFVAAALGAAGLWTWRAVKAAPKVTPSSPPRRGSPPDP